MNTRVDTKLILHAYLVKVSSWHSTLNPAPDNSRLSFNAIYFWRARELSDVRMDERNEITDATIANNRFEHVRSRTISFTLLTSIIVTLARSTWMRSSLIPGCLSVCQGRTREGCARLERSFTIRIDDFQRSFFSTFKNINEFC